MKAILEFNLDEHEDRMAHMRCTKSVDMAWVLSEILINLEKKVQHEVSSFEADSDVSDGVYAAFRRIRELVNDRGIIIEDLIE